jgi:hypothetical protein
MSEKTIPDLWPTSLRIEALSPYVILRGQATKLTERMHGMVEGLVRSRMEGAGLVCHTFEIVAPVLPYRFTLFRAWHQDQIVYPVVVTTGVSSPIPPEEILRVLKGSYFNDRVGNPIPDEAGLYQRLSDIVSAAPTVSLINSLVAQTNDRREGISPTFETDDIPGPGEAFADEGEEPDDATASGNGPGEGAPRREDEK